MARLLLAINDERRRLMLDDLAALPDRPGIVAEGAPLRPAAVARRAPSRSHALWLLPAPEAIRRNLTARGGTGHLATSDADRAWEHRLQRELLVADTLAAEAESLGLATLRIEESDDLDLVERRVEAFFRPVLAALPRAASVDERFRLRRMENETVLSSCGASSPIRVGRRTDTSSRSRASAGEAATSCASS